MRMRRRFASLLMFVVILAVGCGSDSEYTCDLCVEEPEAVPADDNRPTGVYKGVATTPDDSGTLKAVVETDESSGTAVVIFGGNKYIATSFSIDTDGQGNTVYTFSGGGFTLIIVVTSTGDIVSVTLDIDGEGDIGVDMAKESSTQLVKCYEGTWSGNVDGIIWNGTWNFIIVGSYLQGSYKGDTSGSYVGQVNGSSLDIDLYSGSAQGSLGGDCASGNWALIGYTGTWSGCRTL